MNLIILEPGEINKDGRCVLSDDRAQHIASILKPRLNDLIEIGVVDGCQGVGRIISIESNRVEFQCLWHPESHPEPPIIDIICALPRPQTLKKILHTVAAMSVRHLYLIRANRVEKSYFHSPLLQESNYRKHLIEGLSQGKVTKIPSISLHDKFRNFFEDYLPKQINFQASTKLIADPDTTYKVSHNRTKPPVILAIGPEGGWVPFELEMMEHIGFKRFMLGPWILRVENALVAALSQIELTLDRSV